MNGTPEPNLPPTPDYAPKTSVAHPSMPQQNNSGAQPQATVQITPTAKKSLKRVIVIFLIISAITFIGTAIFVAVAVSQFTAQFDGLTETMQNDINVQSQ